MQGNTVIQKKVTLQVNNDADFRLEVAKAIVKEAQSSYCCESDYYADVVEGVVYLKKANASWNPWKDSIDWRIVSVNELVPSGYYISPEVDWNIADIPYRDIVADYLESENEEFEANGDIPEWVSKQAIIGFARDSSKWSELIEKIEEEAEESAINFAVAEILDEIEIEFDEMVDEE